MFEPRIQRSLHLLFLVPLIFLAFPFNRRSPKGRPSAFDWLWAGLSSLASLYLIWDADRLNHRWEGASPVLPDSCRALRSTASCQPTEPSFSIETSSLSP